MQLTAKLTNIKNSTLFFAALGLMLASIPLSRFAMSVLQFTLLGLWFWHLTDRTYLRSFTPAGLLHPTVLLRFIGQSLTNIYSAFILKLKLFLGNKAAMVMASLYLLHIIGLLHTSNFDYALKDLRVKLPLLVAPLLLSTGPRPTAFIRKLLLSVFISAVLAGTIISACILFYGNVSDPREISVFISHIRFSLSICLSVFILGYFITNSEFETLWVKLLLALLILWFILFLVFMESITGLMISGILLLIILFYLVLKQKQIILKVLLALLILLIPISGFFYIRKIVLEYSKASPVNINGLDKYSSSGTAYIHDTINYEVENGQYIGLYLALPELPDAWNKRSSFNYYGNDKHGQQINTTIIRFLNSKGYRKDKEGIMRLSDKEVHTIEEGVANAEYTKKISIRAIVYQFILGYNQYHDKGNPNASSAMQRLEFWKTSLILIKHNWLVGVGTGDLPDAFTKQYEEMNSPLQKIYRWRSHNQYLSIFIAFGIFGFLWFIFTLFYPAFITRRYRNYYYAIFWIIVILSMLAEDTLETQDGVTFFAFFNAFLLFSGEEEKEQE
jgi:hypothetical protein